MKKLVKCKGVLVVGIFNLIMFSFMLILIIYFIFYDKGMSNSGQIRLIIISLTSFFSVIGAFVKNKVGWALTGLPYMFLTSLFLFFIFPFHENAINAGAVVILISNIFYALLNTRKVQEYFNLSIPWLLLLNIVVMGIGFLLARLAHFPL